MKPLFLSRTTRTCYLKSHPTFRTLEIWGNVRIACKISKLRFVSFVAKKNEWTSLLRAFVNSVPQCEIFPKNFKNLSIFPFSLKHHASLRSASVRKFIICAAKRGLCLHPHAFNIVWKTTNLAPAKRPGQSSSARRRNTPVIKIKISGEMPHTKDTEERGTRDERE